jgi:hypothetical protein
MQVNLFDQVEFFSQDSEYERPRRNDVKLTIENSDLRAGLYDST